MSAILLALSVLSALALLIIIFDRMHNHGCDSDEAQCRRCHRKIGEK
jgi:hypothetical protein